MRALRLLPLLPFAALLGGCDMVVFNPSGDVALQQRNLIIASTVLMLLIIVPVIAATIAFAWRYRASNTSATYTPDWHHSTQLEVLIWTAPLLIIIALGALTWISTHVLDPFRTLSRVDSARPVVASTKPLTIEVVSLDWKWLFIYPEQGIATINEVAAPVDRPVEFKITSSSVMNTFFVPALAGQIYSMAGMETKLNAVMNETGTFDGFSANYSGAGFSGMSFKYHSLNRHDFDTWVEKVKHDGRKLDRPGYLALAEPSERNPVAYYGTVDPGLYDAILNMCVAPGTTCMSQMMAADEAATGKSEPAGAHSDMKSMGDVKDKSDAKDKTDMGGQHHMGDMKGMDMPGVNAAPAAAPAHSH